MMVVSKVPQSDCIISFSPRNNFVRNAFIPASLESLFLHSYLCSYLVFQEAESSSANDTELSVRFPFSDSTLVIVERHI